MHEFPISKSKDCFVRRLAETSLKPMLRAEAADLWQPLDLSIHNVRLRNALNQDFANLQEYRAAMENFINGELQGAIGYGGYGEQRNLYEKSPYFIAEGESRCIHLGVDIWQAAGTPFYLPLDGVIHSFQVNDMPLDYGGTIITKHQIGEMTFYLLFGHLSHESLVGLSTGQSLNAGQQICKLGKPEENGGWPPHLHFQVILDLEGTEGDFPGVATAAEAGGYLSNCPDPAVFFDAIRL